MSSKLVACPKRDMLIDFGLGKLEAAIADTIFGHLETCADCREVVAGITGDSFLDRMRRVQCDAPDAEQKPPDAERSRKDSVSSKGAETEAFLPSIKDAAPDRASGFSGDLADAPAALREHADYEILKELGRGGMGVVYLARNRTMNRLEVLKVVNRTLLDREGATERFLREIRAAAMLNHRNIVTAYSALRIGELLVFAMEYVEGHDLALVISERGPLPVVNTAVYGHQVALGLQHAFEKGMVHRDVKPNNLILSRRGKKHTVKILDFGLAKASSEKSVAGGLTGSGQMLGTPDFVAPEQTLDAQNADIRADIYSLGCTLYNLLAGHPPFRASNLYELLQAHHTELAQPLNQIRPDVPVELANVIARMMAKDPAERQQTPDEVAKELAPFFKANGPGPDIVGNEPTKGIVSDPAPSATVVEQPLPVAHSFSPTAVALQTTILQPSPPEFPAADPHPGNATLLSPAANWRSPNSLFLRIAVPVVFGLLAVALASVCAVLWTGIRGDKAGIVTIEVNQPYADVFVDGNRVQVAWEGGGRKGKLSASPGSRLIELQKKGFKTFSTNLVVEADAHTAVPVELTPLVFHGSEGAAAPPAEPSPPEIEAQPPSASQERTASPSQVAPGPAPANPAGETGKAPPLAVAPFDDRQALRHQEAWAQYLKVPIRQRNFLHMELVLIPSGEFTMGSTDQQREQGRRIAEAENIKSDSWEFNRLREEVPAHRVTLSKPFLLSATEVTMEQFKEFVDATKYITEAEQAGFGEGLGVTLTDKITPAQKERTWRNPGHLVTDDSPVAELSWNDAARFCNWLSEQERLTPVYHHDPSGSWERVAAADGYRLPTEAEWEFACRAGTSTQFSFGDDPLQYSQFAWFSGNSGGSAHTVGMKLPNAFGLHDMHGNVLEWCADYYDMDYYAKSPPVDPRGPTSGPARAVRGGSCAGPFYGRSAFRSYHTITCRHSNLGLRVARDAPKPARQASP